MWSQQEVVIDNSNPLINIMKILTVLSQHTENGCRPKRDMNMYIIQNSNVTSLLHGVNWQWFLQRNKTTIKEHNVQILC